MMTLREWLDSQPRGALTKMARATGYLVSTLTRIADGVTRPKQFTANCIQDYTGGVVTFQADRVLCPAYRVALNGKYWNVCYGHKYIASRKTQADAQALANIYTLGMTA